MTTTSDVRTREAAESPAVSAVEQLFFCLLYTSYFFGAVPVTAPLTPEAIESEYEANTGVEIIRTMEGRDPLGCPAVLVAGHAPFCWGKSASDAVHTAVIVEELAAMAWQTLTINPVAVPISCLLYTSRCV